MNKRVSSHENPKNKIGFTAMVVAELMATRGELGIMAHIISKIDGIDEKTKQQLNVMAERNLDRFDKLEPIYKRMMEE